MMSSRASRAPTARLPAAFSVQQCNRDISRLFHQQHYPHKQQHHKCRENAEADGRDPQLALHKLLVQNLIMSSAIEYVNIHGVLRREISICRIVWEQGVFRKSTVPCISRCWGFLGGRGASLPTNKDICFTFLGHPENTLRHANMEHLDREVVNMLRIERDSNLELDLTATSRN